MKRISTLLATLSVLIGLSACSGTIPAPPTGVTGATTVTASHTVRVCSGLTDTCANIVPRSAPSLSNDIPSGPKVPDVSSYQGHPNWAATKAAGYLGAVVKAGEYVTDPDFAYNVASLKALHMFWAPYWFIRSCNDGPLIVNAVNAVGGLTSGPVVLDMEVPAAAGCAPQLEAYIFAHFGRKAVIYTGPGTWAGGSNAGLPLWEADYNFSTSISAFWSPLVAWQFTDSHIGPQYYVTGVGYGDVSVDYGLFKLVPAPPKPVDPYAIFPKTSFKVGDVKVSEYLTVKSFVNLKCENPVRREACKADRADAGLLRGRDYFLASHKLARGSWVAVSKGHFRWSTNHLGARYQLLSRVLTNTKPITL